jgi:hypothetical protein
MPKKSNQLLAIDASVSENELWKINLRHNRTNCVAVLGAAPGRFGFARS